MSTQAPRPPAPAGQATRTPVAKPPVPAPRVQQPPSARASRASALASRATSRTSTLLRSALIVALIALVVAGGVAWLLTNQLIAETERIDDSTGEVLIGNQTILASLAEADAAAAAVHLAGPAGDRLQRSTYEQALERAGTGLERIARVLGDDDDSHEALQRINTSLTQYAGLVESARARSIADIQPDANQDLSAAIQLLREDISPNVDLVTQRADARFDADADSAWYVIAPVALIVPLIVLLLAQRWLTGRFRRLFNPPLVLATIILVVLIAWIAVAGVVQQDSLQEARVGAYQAIEKTAELQRNAFQYRARDAQRVIEESPIDLTAEKFTVEGLIDETILLADSPREEAASIEVQKRWAEYIEASNEVTAAVDAGRFDQARNLIRGDSNTAFTGFNTSVEGALFDNRTQFDAAVDSARASLRWLALAIPVGVLLTALLTWFGLSIRLREYR